MACRCCDRLALWRVLTGAFNVNMGTASPGPRLFFAVCMTGTYTPAGASLMSTIGTAGHDYWDGGPGDMEFSRDGINNRINLFNNLSNNFTLITPMRLGLPVTAPTGPLG